MLVVESRDGSASSGSMLRRRSGKREMCVLEGLNATHASLEPSVASFLIPMCATIAHSSMLFEMQWKAMLLG